MEKLMTKKQAERAERNRQIVSEYEKLDKQFPEATRNLKISKIAELVGVTSMCIRRVLINKGVY